MQYFITLLICTTMVISSDGRLSGITYFDFINSGDSTAFNFQRQYFSYAVDVDTDVSFKVVFDVGRTETETDARLNTYLKKAQIDYKTSYGKFSMGLIGTNTYSVQEKNWGYRFIEKSAIDRYGYSSTADLGFGFSRSIDDNLNMSLQVTNGEGYKKLQGDKFHKISFNTTYVHTLNQNDGYNAGFIYSTEAALELNSTNMIGCFGGFYNSRLRIGVEYNKLKQRGSIDKNLLSISTTYHLKDEIDLFVRYDKSKEFSNPEKTNSNYYTIAGIVFNCGKGLSVSPNWRVTSSGVNSVYSADVNEFKVNFEFKF